MSKPGADAPNAPSFDLRRPRATAGGIVAVTKPVPIMTGHFAFPEAIHMSRTLHEIQDGTVNYRTRREIFPIRSASRSNCSALFTNPSQNLIRRVGGVVALSEFT